MQPIDNNIEMTLRLYKKKDGNIDSPNKILECFNGNLISYSILCDGCDKDITNNKIHNINVGDNVIDLCIDCFTNNYN